MALPKLVNRQGRNLVWVLPLLGNRTPSSTASRGENPMIGFLNRKHCFIIGFTDHFKLLIHGQSAQKKTIGKASNRGFIDISGYPLPVPEKSIFTTVKWPKIGHVLAGSISRVLIPLKVFVPRVGKRSDRLINRARSPVGVLDQSLNFHISPANPIILEVTNGTTKIDDKSIRPEGGILINSNHPYGMPLSIPPVEGCLCPER